MITGAAAFEGLHLGDKRRERRVHAMVQALEANPSLSLPKALVSDAAAEAAYRLLGNHAVRHPTIVGHLNDVAWRNAAGAPVVLAVHDTTEFSFDGSSRKGLTEFSRVRQGFFAHTALLVAADGVPRALGVGGCDVYVVRDKKWFRCIGAGEEVELEIGSERWTSLALAVGASKPDGVDLVHVMDREGDCFELLAELQATGESFVVRSAHDRVIQDAAGKLTALLAAEPVVAQRDIWIGERRAASDAPPKSRKASPVIPARAARLEVRFSQVTVRAPRDARVTDHGPLKLWVVDVVEAAPPEGATQVHWRLLTNRPVLDADGALGIVDIYRRRWLIEEFFKSIKTGCEFESRQLESLETLTNLLALLLPVALGLLNLRSISRETPTAPASAVVNDVQLAILKARVPQRLGTRPTARSVMMAIAQLGGHLKQNGEPGWITLGRGWADLLLLEQGWRAALVAMSGGNGGQIEM
jgi:hypothetical protein